MTKIKAVFLDRDGVINLEIGAYVWRMKDFELNPSLIPALKKWQKDGYKFVVITNQGGIAKGLYTHADVRKIHRFLEEKLSEEGIQLLAIYYSPHHPDFGNSLSRKPGSLMIERALARYNIDPSQSVMIGDQPRDMEAAAAAGIRGIRVESNSDLESVEF